MSLVKLVTPILGLVLGCATADRSSPPPTSRNIDSTQVCKHVPTLAQANILFERTYCGNPISYRGRTICHHWRDFLSAGELLLTPSAFSIGPTFRVEQARNGLVVWSEENPMHLILNPTSDHHPDTLEFANVSPDDDDQRKEAEAYLAASFEKREDVNSSLHSYIKQLLDSKASHSFRRQAGPVYVASDCKNVIYAKASRDYIYVMLSSWHSNAWEYDSHPVIYFSLLAPR